ncbi:hypothetical protein Ciccas_004703 [Cichlidogyrus casuarinus]|uniref:BED-type domain-containing protein n=1 Tax=Cichlidogyrus casuarinus TaxID=1844966 RepID=A0ABD2QAV6_9PLAT
MDASTPRSFRLTSKVWNYFTYEESTDTSVCCCTLDSNSTIQCKARLKGRRNNNLKSHLKNKHPLDYATLYNSIQATLENSEPITIDSDSFKEDEVDDDSPLWNYFTYSTESDESSCRILDNGVMCQFKVSGKLTSKLYSHLDKFHPVEYFDVKGSPLEDDSQFTQSMDESLNYINKLAVPKMTNGRPCTSAVWSYFVYDKTNDKCQCLVVVDKDSNETCSRYVSGKNPGNLKSHLRSVHTREYLVVMQADKLSKGDISSAESFQNELSMLDESGSFEQQDKRRSVAGVKASTSSLWNYFKYDPYMNECSCEIFEAGQQCDFKSPGKLHRMMIAHLKSVHFNAYVDVRIAQKRNSQKFLFKNEEDGDLEDNEKYIELIQSVAGKKLLPPPPATEFLTADELTRYNRGRPRNTNVCQYFVFNAELNSSFCLLKNPATNQPCPVEIIGRLSIRLLRHLKTMHPMEYVNATNSSLNVALTQGISSTAELSHFVIGMEEFISQVISKFFYFHEVVNLSVCIVDDGTGLCNAQLIGNNPTMLFSHIHNAHPVLYANLNETRLNPVPSYDNHNHGNDHNLYELCHRKIHPITKPFKYCAPIKRAICWLNDPAKDAHCCVRLDPDRYAHNFSLTRPFLSSSAYAMCEIRPF